MADYEKQGLDPTPRSIRGLIVRLRNPTLGLVCAHLGVDPDKLYEAGVVLPDKVEAVLGAGRASLARIADYLETHIP